MARRVHRGLEDVRRSRDRRALQRGRPLPVPPLGARRRGSGSGCNRHELADDRDEPGSWTAEYRPWAIDGDRAVAAGVSPYLAGDGETVEREYHNVFLYRFDDEGHCSEFTELFMRRDDG